MDESPVYSQSMPAFLFALSPMTKDDNENIKDVARRLFSEGAQDDHSFHTADTQPPLTPNNRSIPRFSLLGDATNTTGSGNFKKHLIVPGVHFHTTSHRFRISICGE